MPYRLRGFRPFGCLPGHLCEPGEMLDRQGLTITTARTEAGGAGDCAPYLGNTLWRVLSMREPRCGRKAVSALRSATAMTRRGLVGVNLPEDDWQWTSGDFPPPQKNKTPGGCCHRAGRGEVWVRGLSLKSIGYWRTGAKRRLATYTRPSTARLTAAHSVGSGTGDRSALTSILSCSPSEREYEPLLLP